MFTICHELAKIYRLWHQQLLPTYKFLCCAIFIRRRRMTLIIFQPTLLQLSFRVFSPFPKLTNPARFSAQHNPWKSALGPGPGHILCRKIMKMGEYTKTFCVKYFTCRLLKTCPTSFVLLHVETLILFLRASRRSVFPWLHCKKKKTFQEEDRFIIILYFYKLVIFYVSHSNMYLTLIFLTI